MSIHRNLRRVIASCVRSIGGLRLAVLAVCGIGIVGGAGLVLAQGASDQQIRCMQLQQDLASAQGGGGAGRDALPGIDQQIAQADRVFQGTQAAMEDAGCFQSFFIFGKALVRSPQCLKMNDRVEDARRQLGQLQQQREAVTGGGGNKRRQAELMDALARSGCGGRVAPKRGGGLLDFFGGGQEQEEEQPQTPVYRSIDPNGRYRSVCVRLCDGFFYPISYSTYSGHLGQEAQECQSTCAAPAELYVYRNPGQEIEQAISLNGSAYMDLPVALKYRKEYVKGCSCKQVEYSPTDIEAANKRAEAEAAAKPVKGKGKGKAPAPPAPAPQAAAPAAAPGDQAAAPQLNLEVTGSNEPAAPASPEAELKIVPPAQKPPAPPTAAVTPPPPPAPAAAAQPAAGQPAAGQSTIAKKTIKTPPAPAPQ
ncbi:MAG TPA: DUF2865 domain-containing protein [Methyloceanibacter sp.]|nr:DUF2865 domain-containing protein [Methyloceanibacter sp.]